MSNIFKSEFLNEYFKENLEKEDFTLEDLRQLKKDSTQVLAIINENPDELIKIGSEDLKVLCNLGFENF